MTSAELSGRVTATGRLSRLSAHALRLASHLGDLDLSTRARWLYDYGRVPRTPAIDRNFGPGDEPMWVLGLARGAPVRRALEDNWLASANQGWYSFFPMQLDPDFQASCKLYVSPRPEALAHAFPVIAHVFATTAVRSFKVGRGREGLLRPDKIVAYFNDAAHAGRVAAELVRSLPDCPVQGVPFTTELGGDGLVSWAQDPDAGATGVSWRSWLTRQVAAAFVDASGAPGDVVENVLIDLRGAGIDAQRWTRVGSEVPQVRP